jgi:hypothetical protein
VHNAPAQGCGRVTMTGHPVRLTAASLSRLGRGLLTCPRMRVVQDPGRMPREPCLHLWGDAAVWRLVAGVPRGPAATRHSHTPSSWVGLAVRICVTAKIRDLRMESPFVRV